ncbi:MAG: TetR/AcrR family transcriptional regulator [Hyphomicrobiaceae bacterium]
MATRRVIEETGFQKLSAREIARAIEYAPGTLYNMFQNLEDILLRVESRILDELDQTMGRAMSGTRGAEAVRRFAAAYIDYAYQHPRLWELLQEHYPSSRKAGPDWYLERLYAPLARLENAVGQIAPRLNADDTARTARLIWTSLHGLLQVATNPKFGQMPLATTRSMAETLAAQLAPATALAPSRSSTSRRIDADSKPARPQERV